LTASKRVKSFICAVSSMDVFWICGCTVNSIPRDQQNCHYLAQFLIFRERKCWNCFISDIMIVLMAIHNISSSVKIC
jgi:hypothetical protein